MSSPASTALALESNISLKMVDFCSTLLLISSFSHLVLKADTFYLSLWVFYYSSWLPHQHFVHVCLNSFYFDVQLLEIFLSDHYLLLDVKSSVPPFWLKSCHVAPSFVHANYPLLLPSIIDPSCWHPHPNLLYTDDYNFVVVNHQMLVVRYLLFTFSIIDCNFWWCNNYCTGKSVALWHLFPTDWLDLLLHIYTTWMLLPQSLITSCRSDTKWLQL